MNRITVAPQGNGTQIWSSTDVATGDVIRYLFRPVAALSPGDRIEDMSEFRRRANGNGVERVTVAHARVLTPPIIATFPAGSFVRVREALPSEG